MSEQDTTPKFQRDSWDTFVQIRFKKPQLRDVKSGEAWVPGVFGQCRNTKGRLRHDGNMLHMTALVLDLDGKERAYTFDEIVATMNQRRHAWHAHTTYTSCVEANRYKWRVIVPLATPLAPDRYRAAVEWLRDVTGLQCDTSCMAPSHLYFLPACPPSRLGFYAETGNGVLPPLDPATLPYPYPPPGTGRVSKNRPSNPSYTSTATTNTTTNTHTRVLGSGFAPLRALPPAHKRDWFWVQHFDPILEQHRLEQAGTRNQLQIDLIRALLRTRTQWDERRLHAVFTRWFDGNREHISSTTTEAIAWREFKHAFLLAPKVRQQLDVKPLKRARAIATPVKLRPDWQTLLNACHALQAAHPIPGRFYLTYEDAGRILGRDKWAAKRAFQQLIKLGLLERLSTGNNLKKCASTYRCLKRS